MSYDKFAKKHIVAVTGVIRNQDGKFLVIKRSEHEIAHPGEYTFPGGKSEGNESIEETLRQEIAEETGLAMLPGKLLLKDASFVRPDGQTVKVLSFLCEVADTTAITLSDDFTDFRWVDLAELQQLPHVGIEEEIRQANRLAQLTPDQLAVLQTKSQRDD